MSDDKKNVRDLTLRRQKQMQQTDPVVILAKEITGLVAARAVEMRPEEQLVALELSVKALLEVLRHAHGDVGLNAIHLEVEHKRKQYTPMMWPKDDQSPTVYDNYEPTPDTEPSPVVQILGEDDETER